MTDVDDVEFDHAKAVAILSLKSEGQDLTTESLATTQVHRQIADALGVPLIAVAHREDLSRFRVLPSGEELSELDFVEWLYSLRNRAVPRRIIELLLATPVVQYKWRLQMMGADGNWSHA